MTDKTISVAGRSSGLRQPFRGSVSPVMDWYGCWALDTSLC